MVFIAVLATMAILLSTLLISIVMPSMIQTVIDAIPWVKTSSQSMIFMNLLKGSRAPGLATG